MELLKDKHKGQTAWIIGKGPSLQRLRKEDIGEGVVIAINEAIMPVESLGLPNPIYSMQKDGGNRRRPSKDNLCPDCDHSGQCGDVCGDMIRPTNGAILLLHEGESKYCFPDYPRRYVLNLKNFNLPGNIFSLTFALKTAQYMGCVKFRFVSCDAHALGDLNSYDPKTGTENRFVEFFLLEQLDKFKPYLAGLDYAWIIPKDYKYLKISFGVLINDPYRNEMVLRRSRIQGEMHYVRDPKSATEGLNKLLDVMDDEGADIAILTHQDMYYRENWLSRVREQIRKLPESWIIAGIAGKDMEGNFCGKFHTMQVPFCHDTSKIHSFPQEACCVDECTIIVNLKKKFRFDEELDNFHLYGTLAVLQAWKMGGTAWVIDAFAEHYSLRYLPWVPDEVFCRNYKWLYQKYGGPGVIIDSTGIQITQKEVTEDG